jgi:hypothetical protein
MRNQGLVIAFLLMVVVAGSASAEEVIHFTNGTVMPIRSHKIEGDLIKVDLGDDGFMAFPKSVVEKIEEAPDVVLMPSTTNKMFPSDPSTRVFGASPRQAANSWALPGQMDASGNDSGIRSTGGVISVAPFANDENAGLRNLRVNSVPEMRGATQVRPEDALAGTPQRLQEPSVKTKKALTEIKSAD